MSSRIVLSWFASIPMVIDANHYCYWSNARQHVVYDCQAELVLLFSYAPEALDYSVAVDLNRIMNYSIGYALPTNPYCHR